MRPFQCNDVKRSVIDSRCGGHFNDFLHLLNNFGPPSQEHTFIFNGDFVDWWDALLWLIAFVFIELNVLEWRQEDKENEV